MCCQLQQIKNENKWKLSHLKLFANSAKRLLGHELYVLNLCLLEYPVYTVPVDISVVVVLASNCHFYKKSHKTHIAWGNCLLMV